jgi:hypothetical protein
MSLQQVASVRFITDDGTTTTGDTESNKTTRPVRKTPVVTTDLEEVLRRFRMRDDPFCPSKQFNGDTFKRKSDEYRARLQWVEKHRIHVGGGRGNNSQGQGISLTINASSTLKGLFFFEGPVSGHKFSVESASDAEAMRQAGFREFKMDHFSDSTKLPKAEMVPNDDTDATMGPVPSQVKLPNFRHFDGKFPPLYLKERGEKFAIALLRAWEERVIVDNVVYSPYKDWTNKDLLKQHGFKDDFTNKSKAYIAIKKVCNDKDDPATSYTSTALARKATGWSGKGDKSWFDIAVSIANNSDKMAKL